MKKAFTLVELMIVIAVLAILMGLIFKLTGVGSDSWRRTRTITHMQKVENCLSGYHAAFGCYPPVKLHGSRDIFRRVDVHGIQTDDRNESIWGWNNIGETAERVAWRQVNSACRSQPVDCRFPYASGYSRLVDAISEEMKRRASSGNNYYKKYFEDENIQRRLMAGFDDGSTRNVGRHSKNKGYSDWRNVQLFKFGLMSFLLPRYMVMMNGDEVFFRDYAQWLGNNEMPSNPFTGQSFDLNGGWTQIKRYATSNTKSDMAHIANIPSQAVCARWMPNLEGVCQANHGFSLFGINIQNKEEAGELDVENVDIEIFTPGGADSDSTSNQYILDGITVRDGWYHDLYYYSPAPYQRYTLWSAGPNGRTFPPWISRKRLSAKANECIGKWVWDDIIHMSN